MIREQDYLPVDQSSTKGCEKSLLGTKPGASKYGRRVVGNHIDTTKLLHIHDEKGGLSSSSVSWNGEEFCGTRPC